jgi:hypothetical protein
VVPASREAKSIEYFARSIRVASIASSLHCRGSLVIVVRRTLGPFAFNRRRDDCSNVVQDVEKDRHRDFWGETDVGAEAEFARNPVSGVIPDRSLKKCGSAFSANRFNETINLRPISRQSSLLCDPVIPCQNGMPDGAPLSRIAQRKRNQ